MALAEQPVATAMSWIIASLRNNVAFSVLVAGKSVAPFPHDISTRYPGVGLSLINQEDVNVVGGVIVQTRMDWSIVAVDKAATISTVQPIALKFHQILHNQFDASLNPGSSGTVLSCVRTEPIYYAERDKEDVVWQYLGGLYRIVVQ